MTNLNPFLQMADAAGGGGSQGGSQQGTGASGAGGGGFSQQGGSQGGSSAVALSDDTKFIVDGKEVSWKEHREANFAPKAEIENARKATRAEIEANLRKLAQTLQQKPQQQQQQRVDPLAGFRDLPILSGQQLAQALDGTLGPVAQAVAHLQQQNQQLAAQVKKLSGGVGTLAKERSGQERASRVEAALKGLGVEGIDLKDEHLNELAQDILDAWEFEKPDEYPAMLQKRFQGLRKAFRALDKKELELAKSRRFTRPGGGASPSGAPRFDPRNAAKHAADMLFGAPNANT